MINKNGTYLRYILGSVLFLYSFRLQNRNLVRFGIVCYIFFAIISLVILLLTILQNERHQKVTFFMRDLFVAFFAFYAIHCTKAWNIYTETNDSCCLQFWVYIGLFSSLAIIVNFNFRYFLEYNLEVVMFICGFSLDMETVWTAFAGMQLQSNSRLL